MYYLCERPPFEFRPEKKRGKVRTELTRPFIVTLLVVIDGKLRSKLDITRMPLKTPGDQSVRPSSQMLPKQQLTEVI
jgi:hypothetical protein